MIGLPAGIVAIAAGDQHSMALDGTGAVWVWGANNYGQCGVGTVTTAGRPTPTMVVNGIRAIAAGNQFSASLSATSGNVFTWGRNHQGQLGYAVAGTALGNQSTPLQVPSLSGIDAIGAGPAANHISAIKNDGSIWSWGQNQKGQLGHGVVEATARVKAPTQVMGLNLKRIGPAVTISGPTANLPGPANIDVTVRAIDEDGVSSIALYANSTLVASVTDLQQTIRWAGAPAGQHLLYVIAYDSKGVAGQSNQIIVNVNAGGGNTVATPSISVPSADLRTSRDCTITCATPGATVHYTTNGLDPTFNDPQVPANSSIWIDRSMTLKARAFNTGMTASAVATEDYRVVGQVVAAMNHTLALGFDGSIWAWGDNASGQLGINSVTDRKMPFRVLLNPFDNSTELGVVSSLSAGDTHVLMLRIDGQAYGWGNDAIQTPSLFAKTNAWPFKYRDIAAGNGFTVGATWDGRVVGWGKNQSGQLGNGSTAGPTSPLYAANGLGGVVDVAAGDAHVIALCADRSVWTWGGNASGQLGIGTSGGTKLIPTRVLALDGKDVVAVEAGDNHSFALLSNGTVYGWGMNTGRQLGNGGATNVLAPQLNPYLTNVKALAAGNIHSAALKYDGTLHVWGTNTYGQLGDNTTTASLIPKKVNNLGEVVSFSVGNNHTVAATISGAVFAWGINSSGQIGDLSITTRKLPSQTAGILLTGQFKLDVGKRHSIALSDIGEVWNWGDNGVGQLGNGYGAPVRSPRKVIGLPRMIDVSAGENHSLAASSDGAVFAWGGNAIGQLGDGSYDPKATPVELPGLSDIVSVEAGEGFSLAISSIGELWYWGLWPAPVSGIYYERISTPVSAGSKFSTVRAGRGHFIGISDGQAVTGGENLLGQLGIGNTFWYSGIGYSPYGAGFTNEAAAVAAGDDHCLMLAPNGTVWAWGRNSNGQLGDNTSVNRSSPVQVKASSATAPLSGAQAAGTITNLTGVIAIWAGGDTSYAQKSDGTIWAWGRNATDGGFNKFGSPTMTIASSWAAVKSVGAVGLNMRSISASENHALVLNYDGTAFSSGDNSLGQLGNRNTVLGSAGFTLIPDFDLHLGNVVALPPIDVDNDAVDDHWEMNYFFHLNANLALDVDNDGLTSLQEYLIGLNPNNPDSDGDGVDDGAEVQAGSDPNSAASHPPTWKGVESSLIYDFNDYPPEAGGITGNLVKTAGWNLSLNTTTPITGGIAWPSLLGRLIAPPQTMPALVTGGLSDAAGNASLIPTPHPCYHATLASKRFWLEVSPATPVATSRTVLLVTTPTIDGTESAPTVQAVTATIPAGATTSQPIDVRPTFTTNPTGNTAHTETVNVSVVPVEIKVVDRDDPKKRWSDNVLKTAPVYSGKSCGDMVSWKIGGTDSWTNATFSWSAEGPEAKTGPSGTGKNEWKIADGDEDTAKDWLDWKPGKYKIKCAISFGGGSSSTAEFEQEVHVRTEQYFVVGTIPDEGEDTTGVLPRVIDQWSCPNILYSIGATLGGGINSTQSSLFIPFDVPNRVYVNQRLLNSTRNFDPAPAVKPEKKLAEACGLDPYKHYRWFAGGQFKFKIKDNKLAAPPEFVLDNKADIVGFTPLPCSQSNAAGFIGEKHPDSGKLTGATNDAEFIYLTKNRAGKGGQTGFRNLNGRELPWVFFRFRFEAKDDGLIDTKFGDGPSSDPNGPDSKDYATVPTMLVYRRHYDLQAGEWKAELERRIGEQRRTFFRIGTPVSGAPFVMP